MQTAFLAVNVVLVRSDRDLNAALNLNQDGRDTLQPDLKCTLEQMSDCGFIRSFCVDGVNMSKASIFIDYARYLVAVGQAGRFNAIKMLIFPGVFQ